ncbi:uncharacterized protein LOC110443890 [Mizuhopecten yessoensis]|uniref:uncharacterized protein LOC110443890 n=1 Tax=Mizuhopecten yessoensis TaxID=6573 RepID=UPI000B45AB76|nr:uncharacterized protein LOC110443890 [Mizuhopecten yessoensis]
MPMDHRDKAKIRAHMEYIIGNFDVTDFITDLVGRGLTLETKREIDKVEKIRDKNRKCLECLMKSENGSYDVLIELMRKRNYTEIINKLESGLPPEETAVTEEASTSCINVPKNKRGLRLTEKELMYFSKTVSPKDKLKLATCLGVSKHDVDVIDMENHDVRAQMMKLLFIWRNKSRDGCTLGVLMDHFNDAIENGVSIDTDKMEQIIEGLR